MKLGTVLRDWRTFNGMGVREAAKLIGLSSATLNRIENGHNCDGDVLAKILKWIMS